MFEKKRKRNKSRDKGSEQERLEEGETEKEKSPASRGLQRSIVQISSWVHPPAPVHCELAESMPRHVGLHVCVCYSTWEGSRENNFEGKNGGNKEDKR